MLVDLVQRIGYFPESSPLSVSLLPCGYSAPTPAKLSEPRTSAATSVPRQ
jgi:hypothetical protein